MKLNFTNNYYRDKAMNTSQAKLSKHSIEDAFFLLVKDMDMGDLSNLCAEMKKNLQGVINEAYGINNLSLEDCYDLLQEKSSKINNLDRRIKSSIVTLAYKCIEEGKTLGEKTSKDGKFNTSEWVNHSLYEGKLAGELAELIGADKKTAIIQGMLHDYGRKTIHSFEHVIQGYEALIDAGWEDEAVASLTHSFLNGGRCSSNERAEEGFYIDEQGNPAWKEGTHKDDVTIFLENYKYSKCDRILNIADLMATSKGIVSPYDRIQDIATRRSIDPINRSYFLADFTNTLIEFLEEMHVKVPADLKVRIKATPEVTLSEITRKFKLVSEVFFECYQNSRKSHENHEDLIER